MQYTITGIRESAMGRGIVPFCLTTEADSPEQALEKCRRDYGTYDVTSGRAVLIPAELGEVQIRESITVDLPLHEVAGQKELEPVGMDTDGQIKRIEELTQESPSDGING